MKMDHSTSEGVHTTACCGSASTCRERLRAPPSTSSTACSVARPVEASMAVKCNNYRLDWPVCALYHSSVRPHGAGDNNGFGRLVAHRSIAFAFCKFFNT